MNTERIKRFVSLTQTKRNLTSTISGINDELVDLERLILDECHAEGADKPTPVDGQTLYIRRDLTVAKLNEIKLRAALEDNGYGAAIGVNTQSLKSILRELLGDDKTGSWELTNTSNIPPAIRKQVDIGELEKIGMRKSTS